MVFLLHLCFFGVEEKTCSFDKGATKIPSTKSASKNPWLSDAEVSAGFPLISAS